MDLYDGSLVDLCDRLDHSFETLYEVVPNSTMVIEEDGEDGWMDMMDTHSCSMYRWTDVSIMDG